MRRYQCKTNVVLLNKKRFVERTDCIQMFVGATVWMFDHSQSNEQK